MKRGIFISFEGTEGSGKSTQMKLLVERLRATACEVVENQEPGGTSIGKQIRRILLDPANSEMAPMAELLLMFASRAQAAAEVIVPALHRGAIVVSDRFTDSTLAYQGCARGIGFETVRAAHQLAVGSLLPNLTICIDIDIETGLARAHSRNIRKSNHAPGDASETRIDQQSLNFHRRVGAGYHEIAALEPARFRLVNGEGSVEAVAERVWSEVRPILPV
ncbi:MAG TPA: dTMP kinase [Bryobacteraceae bacterium]|nr:dTMP kinase [Bryobacteraceae bacterium]